MISEMTQSQVLSPIVQSTNELPWYAIKVRTRSEPVAAAGLRDREYDPFSPTLSERRKYSDRMAFVNTPLFPGYLFCRLNIHKKVDVLSAPAVEHIVSYAGVPAVVPDDEIDAIRRAVEAGARARPYLAVGQKIRIEYGALAGIEGILERVGKENRIVVSVHLLQRSVSVEINEDQIQRT